MAGSPRTKRGKYAPGTTDVFLNAEGVVALRDAGIISYDEARMLLGFQEGE